MQCQDQTQTNIASYLLFICGFPPILQRQCPGYLQWGTVLERKKLGRIIFGTEHLNSMKYKIIHSHRGSGTLCNVANCFGCGKKIRITLLMFQEMLQSHYGPWHGQKNRSFVLSSTCKKDTRTPQKGQQGCTQREFFLTPVCGWLIPWSVSILWSWHYAFDSGCSYCLYKPLFFRIPTVTNIEFQRLIVWEDV